MQAESLARSLAAHPFVASLGSEFADFLAGCTRNLRLLPGEFLFREGEQAQAIYLIRKGRIAVESYAPPRGRVQLESAEAGAVLGWSALFPPYRWHVDGRVLEPALVFAIDGRCLLPKLEEDPKLGYAFTRRMLYEVHKRLSRARLQQLDAYGGAS
jgi:CRP/FNR family cyclic AMP-dependent transcriptional regulator